MVTPHKIRVSLCGIEKNFKFSYSLMALTKSLKDPYVKSGSGSSLKNIFRAPVVTWMSSHLLSFRSSFSSGEEESVSVYEQ